MCDIVTYAAKKRELEALLQAKLSEGYEPREVVSGFAHPPLWGISHSQRNTIRPMFWGLIPHWVTDVSQAEQLRKMTLNARSETMFEKPAFRDLAQTSRCVIAVSCFYEWQHRGKSKQAYRISLAGQEVFLFGGLAASWVHPETKEIIQTTTIVTTHANPLMQEIHNVRQRQPVIILPENIDNWLNPNTDIATVQELCLPIDDHWLFAEPVPSPLSRKSGNAQMRIL